MLKPVFTLTIVSFLMLFSNTSAAVRTAALNDPQTKRIIAYIVFIAATAPLAVWMGPAVGTAKGLVPAALFFVGFLLVPPRREVLDRLQLAFVALVLFFSAYAQVFGSSWNGRLSSPGGSFDSNDMASLMAMAFPLAAGLLARAVPGRARWLALAAVVTLALGVIASGSRGGTLALVAGVIVFAAAMKGERGVVVVMALVMGGAVAWLTAPDSFRERMVSITSLENDYNYTHETGRKAVWARGRQYWRENFIIGLGANNFPMAEGDYYTESERRGKWSQAHNAYIQAFAELGTIGGGIFVAILLGAARSVLPMWRPKRTDAAPRAPPFERPEILASLVAFAVGAYFLSHAYFNPTYTLLGLAALAARIRQAERMAPTQTDDAPVQDFHVVGQRGGFARSFPGYARFEAMRGGLR
jgi:O-antigen ligase